LVRLGNFSFPGNVRQLENICHWLTLMAPAQLIEPKDLPPEIAPAAGEAPAERPATAAAHTEARRAATADEGAGTAAPASPIGASGPATVQRNWESGLEAEALELLASGRQDVWEELTKRFESRLILTALANTRGRRIEAAQKLGIGRNTITRKIQELGLE
jgi:two-component system, NtrC family, nitrogen regulation response regulator GlnG